MNTAEKVQVTALFAIFLFLSYITVYTVRQTLEWQSRPRRVFLPKAKAQQEEKETVKPAPGKKGARMQGSKRSQDLFTRGQRKASSGDCEGALKDLDAAASLDASLKTQIPSALDSCKQK